MNLRDQKYRHMYKVWVHVKKNPTCMRKKCQTPLLSCETQRDCLCEDPGVFGGNANSFLAVKGRAHSRCLSGGERGDPGSVLMVFLLMPLLRPDVCFSQREGIVKQSFS